MIGARRLAVVCAIGVLAMVGHGHTGLALESTVESGAVAQAPAQRLGNATSTVHTGSCESTAVIGDSLTAISPASVETAFRERDLAVTIDARSARRIPAEVGEPFSGVLATRRLLDAGIDADCWVVGLGSNDLLWVRTPGRYAHDGVGTVDAYVDMMLTEIRRGDPDRRVWWVNLNNRGYVTTGALFNRVLAGRADGDPGLEVIDWFALSEANPRWFVDRVHVDRAGYDARGRLIADTIAAARDA